LPDPDRLRTFERVNLVLVLPGLLASRPAAPEVAAPAIARLVAAGGTPARIADGIGAVLAPRYGVARQADWPLAPIRAAAAGIAPGNSYWLSADPVTLAVGQFDVGLAGVVTDLARDEAEALLSTLNAHFAADGLHFVAPQPQFWFVSAPQPQVLATRPLAAAARCPLRDLAPSGRDAGTWTRWQHEIQMLLYEHPVNAARVERGQAPVNSVWIADGGCAPPRPGTDAPRPTTFAAAGDIAAALAAYVGAPARPVPAGLDVALAGAATAATIVVVPDTPTDLVAIERAWAAPAWRGLTRGRIAAVELVADGNGEAVAWTVRRPGLWRRLATAAKPPALTALLADAGTGR
jgi:hypothetical protein